MQNYLQELNKRALYASALRQDPITAMNLPEQRDGTVKQMGQGKTAGLGDVMQGGMSAVNMNGGGNPFAGMFTSGKVAPGGRGGTNGWHS